MKVRFALFVVSLFSASVFGAPPAPKAAAEKEPERTEAPAAQRPRPSKEQTEQWLNEHLEAWHEEDVVITTSDCRIRRNNRSERKTEILDLRGLILPIEIISLPNSKDVTIRLRVKDKHSGAFSMFRVCDSRNNNCAESTGKFQGQAYVDFTITAVDDYEGRSISTNVDKARRLRSALERYAQLCGASEDARNQLF